MRHCHGQKPSPAGIKVTLSECIREAETGELRTQEGGLEVIIVITPQEAIRRLEAITKGIDALKAALEEGWSEAPAKDATQAFLGKCEGWEDTRTPEEIVADIYTTRSLSTRGVGIFNKE